MSMALIDQLPALPVLLPAATAVLLLLVGDHGGGEHNLNRQLLSGRIAIGSALRGRVMAIQLVLEASYGLCFQDFSSA